MRIIGLLILVAVVIAALVYVGFIDISPEGEEALDNAADRVGTAVEETGQAIRDAGN
ncbi:hypothetical protein [Roseivivax isoporae]|uniref:Uncharacterized protein n=1 Tax=Roseivivax isoporae LMG 25204 TaxID=1449351 RepID=X7F512_9RHOB|nr:hypothetical protein [Roseivivax isoporae]ETX27149.1 hypothetical protein RISW2_15285 [Roseivivax isoporae LMG 25204]